MKPVMRSSGYTLVELLVVLVIVGTLLAVVTPNLFRLYNAAERRAAEESILLQLHQLPLRALVTGSNYLILSQADANAEDTRNRYLDYQVLELDLPDGWAYTLASPLRVKSIGVCLGGEMTLFNRGLEVRTLNLAAPDCRVRG